MEYSALKSEYLIKEDPYGNNPKLDWSILKYINRLCIQRGINLKQIGLCGVETDFNVYELDKKNEKGLYLFRCEDISSFYNKNFSIYFGNCLKDFQIKLDIPGLNNINKVTEGFQEVPQVFNYKPSLIAKKIKEKSTCGFLSYKAVFEINQYINCGQKSISEKLLGVITLNKYSDSSYTFLLGRTEESMKFKIKGSFPACKKCLFDMCRFKFLKPEKIKFDIFTSNSSEVPVGFIYKQCRATFEDLESDTTVVYLPEEAAPEEKIWFIVVANIINMVIFDKE